MNTKFNETIVETNGVRTITGGGTGTTSLSSLRDSLEVLSLSGGVISANSTTDALRITQTGSGNALLVEDSVNPDVTPFLIDSNGTIVIGASAASTKNLSRKGVQFVTSTSQPSRIVELRSHNIVGQTGAQVNFVRTRSGSPNDYSSSYPLSAYDLIGGITFKGGDPIAGAYITCQNKNDSSIGSISGSRVMFENHVASTNSLYTALTLDEDKAGIGTLTPNEALTVVGNISSKNIVYSNDGNSNQWNSVYSNVNTNSAINASINYVNSNFVAVTGATITGNITLSGNILPYTSGKGSFIVTVSDPISLLTTVGTLSSVYQCPTGFRFLPEEISYTFDTISYIGNPNNITITNPMVRLYSRNSTTANADLGPQLTFPLNGGSTQVLNRWFRSSNTATTVVGRPMLIGGTAGSDTAYLRIDVAYASTDISNKYTDLKIKVVLTGYLIKS